MQIEPPASALEPARAHCAYCGGVEPLPTEAAQLERAVRARLAEVRAAHDLPGHLLAQMRDLSSFVLRRGGLVALAPLAGVVAQLGQGRQSVLVGAGQAALVLLAVLIGGALLRRRVHTYVLPELEAVPPEDDGGTFSCRICGADLPAFEGPAVDCPSCGATNLPSAPGMVARARRLERAARRSAEVAAGRSQSIMQQWLRGLREFYAAVILISLASFAVPLVMRTLGAP
jgi:hypothetical protein